MGLIYGFVNDGFYTVDDFNFDESTKKWTLKPGVPDNSSFSSGNFSFKPGAMKFKKLSDSDSDLITEEDMTVIGNTNPKVTGGFGLSGSWKNLDFTAFFNYMCDFDVFNVNKLYLNSAVRRNYSNLSTNMNLARRFSYVDELSRMGASVKVEGNVAVISGVEKFTEARVNAPDLRAGAALVIAGLAAEGITIVDDIYYIERGYENLDEKLRKLGAQIEKVASEKEIQKFRLKVG